jgi:hypothetical protein
LKCDEFGRCFSQKIPLWKNFAQEKKHYMWFEVNEQFQNLINIH